MNDLDHDFVTASDFLGADQIVQFKARFCRPATAAEVTAAGYDIEEILPEESFYFLTVSPTKFFKIPGFRDTYVIKSNWRLGQIMHPWWM